MLGRQGITDFDDLADRWVAIGREGSGTYLTARLLFKVSEVQPKEMVLIDKDQGKILGYAAIETSTVRTKPETLMIVLTPDGELSKVVTLAFHEPPEYQPPERWFEQLYKRPLAEMDFNKRVRMA